MPSFDIVSELNQHELQNAVDQANKEVGTRFDFKGTDSHYELNDKEIVVKTESEFQLQQMLDILQNKFSKRAIALEHMEILDPVVHYKKSEQKIKLKEGVDKEVAKKIIKCIKDAGLKVQTAIQGEQVRVTGKKRDDLQEVMALLRGDESLGAPLQFNNFRD